MFVLLIDQNKLLVSGYQIATRALKADSQDQRTSLRHYTRWILDRMIFMLGSHR